MIKKFHALSKQQRLDLIKSGFIPKEVRELDQNSQTNLADKPFQSLIKARRDWRDAMVLNGWTRLDIGRRVAHWYRIKKERSIWSLFRLEYGLSANRPKLSKSRFSDFLKLRAEISRGFGRAYGRIKSVKLSQRHGLPGIPRKKF